MRELKRDRINLDEALSALLHGSGLRQLARRYGCSHTYISQLLQEKYGRNITNPCVTSLARSLISDYRGCAEAYQYALKVVNTGHVGEKFRSNSALNAATRWLTLDEPELLNLIAHTHDNPIDYLDESEYVWGFLRWYYFYFSINQILADVGTVYYRTLGASLASELVSEVSDGNTKAS